MAIISKWRNGVIYDFLQTIDLFRTNIQGNMLLVDQYNFLWYVTFSGVVQFYFNGYLLDPPSIELCSCALSVYCAESLSVFDENINKLIIEGFALSCTPATSLMLSDLRAFYLMFNPKNFTMHPLTVSNTNRINETIQSIADRSFVDQWIDEISFTKYYKACAP